MATTHSFDLGSGAWTLVSEALANVLIQPQVRGAVLVHIADSATPPALDAPALIISDDRPMFAASSLPNTAHVFARSDAGTIPVVVVRG